MAPPNREDDRYYWRCRECGEPFVTEGGHHAFSRDVLCPWCDSSLIMARRLGRIVGDQWRREEELAACDGRCQGAGGPSCDCKCRGKNHGRYVSVTVVVDSGRVRLQPTDPEAAERIRERARRRAAERARAIELVRERVAQLRAAGHWGKADWLGDAVNLTNPAAILARLAACSRCKTIQHATVDDLEEIFFGLDLTCVRCHMEGGMYLTGTEVALIEEGRMLDAVRAVYDRTLNLSLAKEIVNAKARELGKPEWTGTAEDFLRGYAEWRRTWRDRA